jgi:hypothetical protein
MDLRCGTVPLTACDRHLSWSVIGMPPASYLVVPGVNHTSSQTPARDLSPKGWWCGRGCSSIRLERRDLAKHAYMVTQEVWEIADPGLTAPRRH